MEPDRRDDLYRILQVDPAASPLVIQAAYRVLAQVHHPDVAGDAEAMKRINAAWEVLKDPQKRRRYDAERAGGPRTSVPAPVRTAGVRTHAGGGATTQRPVDRGAGSPVAPRSSPFAAGVRGARSAADAGPTGGPRSESPETVERAGAPVGPPSGPLMTYGRYEGWTLGQIARVDRGFLEWLRNVPAGRGLKHEIDLALRSHPAFPERRSATPTASGPVHTWAPGAKTSLR